MTRPGQDLVCDLPENASLLGHDVLGALRALCRPRDGHEEEGVGREDPHVEEELRGGGHHVIQARVNSTFVVE